MNTMDSCKNARLHGVHAMITMDQRIQNKYYRRAISRIKQCTVQQCSKTCAGPGFRTLICCSKSTVANAADAEASSAQTASTKLNMDMSGATP